MQRTLWRRGLCCVAGVGVVGVAALLLVRALADGNPPTTKPQLAANVLKGRDFGKNAIEVPTKKLLAARTVPATSPPSEAFVNPKVQPGKVHWHKDFADACRAAHKSGKPVLLFQMMGKLDDRFC